MTDIEKQALALVNKTRRINDLPKARDENVRGSVAFPALCRAIEQHEAFRQEVSDALREWGVVEDGMKLSRFILPKPVDPLVEAMVSIGFGHTTGEQMAEELRATLAARGLEIREVGHD